jgi:hypothetical protein
MGGAKELWRSRCIRAWLSKSSGGQKFLGTPGLLSNMLDEFPWWFREVSCRSSTDKGSPQVWSDMYVSISSLCVAGPEVVQVFVRS